MTLSDKTEARRFINFIDTLYDNKVCCVYLLVWCIVIGYFLVGGAGVQCRVSCRSVVH